MVIDWALLAELNYNLDAYAEEISQWANTHQLEAACEGAFDALDLDLSGFGEDENLVPPPHSLTGGKS